MRRKKNRLPAYTTIIGPETEVVGDISFAGGMHIDGKVKGSIRAEDDDACALTLGEAGVIEGNIDVARVVIDGTVIGDVRASRRAELASGARIEGSVYYGMLEMAGGAEVNGKFMHIDSDEPRRLIYHGAATEEAEEGGGPNARDGETLDEGPEQAASPRSEGAST